MVLGIVAKSGPEDGGRRSQQLVTCDTSRATEKNRELLWRFFFSQVPKFDGYLISKFPIFPTHIAINSK